MGCINSKVVALATDRRKTRGGNFLLRGVKNVFFRKNRVVPDMATTHATVGRDDVEQLSTTSERDSIVKPQEFLFRKRFLAANIQTSDVSDTNSSDSSEDHPDTNEECEDMDHMSMINVKERHGGIAFELMDDDETDMCLPNSVYPMASTNDTRSSKGGVAFDIDFTNDAAEMSPVYPTTRMNDTRSSKGGVAFDIDFTDDAVEKRALSTISKVASIMARDGWSERDVIEEADDVWVAKKVLAVKENARRSQERLAAREKAELDYDMITATMTDDDLQDFHFIGMKETSTERSLLRQTFYRAWLAKLRA